MSTPETTRMYPIQNGPSVPWEVMAPHESICQKNHGQSIQRIAERGGFGTSEAWCVVNDLEYTEMERTIGWNKADDLWKQYAERINLHYAELEQLRADKEKAERACAAKQDALNLVLTMMPDIDTITERVYAACHAASLQNRGRGYISEGKTESAKAPKADLQEALGALAAALTELERHEESNYCLERGHNFDIKTLQQTLLRLLGV